MNSNLKKFIIVLPMLLSVILTFSFSFYYDFKFYRNSDEPVVNGKINYSAEAFDNDKIIALDGDWAKTDDIYNNTVSFPECLRFTSKSPVTYEVNITVPEARQFYSILIPAIYSRSALYINNTLQYNNLNMGKDYVYSPQKISTIYAKTTSINVKLIVCNDEGYFPGKLSSFYFGKSDAVSNRSFLMNFSDILLSAISIITFLYYIIAFIFDREDKGNLYMALLCLVVALKILINNPTFMYYDFPFMSFKSGAMHYIAFFYLLIISYLVYVRHFLKKYLVSVFYYTLLITSFAAMILVFFLPLSKYKYLDIVLAITVTITNVLVLIGTIRAIKNKIPFSRTFLLSSSCVLVTGFVDIFDYYTDYLSKRYFTSGFILFIIIQSFSYIIHNTQLYNQETALTVSLSDTLNDLKREESNFLSSHLRAHFLFNALNIISGYSVFEPDKAKEITTALTIYIKQLFEHDNLNELTSLKNEIDLLHAFGFIEEERFPNLNIEYNIPEDIPDIQVPSLILQPLLENAVNHGIRKKSAKEKGTVTITLKKANGFVNFSVRDDGAGCDENIIKQALEEPADGTYNSLFQIQSRLKKLYNQEIIYMSVPDIGTVISFKIPCS